MALTAFIGGGNMASAVIGGLCASGRAPETLVVVDPNPTAREQLVARHGVRTLAAADASLSEAATVVWAVKPQFFRAAALAAAPHVGTALQLSVMAGIPSRALVEAIGSAQVVRAMPNTPALIGRGITGLYARPEVTAAARAEVEAVLAPTGHLLWLAGETDLDAVTALSGSGPAYVFFFAEAMVRAAVEMGLTAAQGRELALATFAGATALAEASEEGLDVLRERVTSRGGTTHAALQVLQGADVGGAFVSAIEAARRRARELGDEFG